MGKGGGEDGEDLQQKKYLDNKLNVCMMSCFQNKNIDWIPYALFVEGH